MRPRIGHIQFLNCLPLYYALVKNNSLLDIDLIKGTPRQLNDLLINGELDIAPIPAVEYARNFEKLALLPDLSIGSQGAVKSILLLSKYDIDDLDGRLIAMTNTSATSQVLLRIILEDIMGLSPRYFESPPDLAQMLREADASLLIGDDALRCSNEDGLKIYDLGQLWAEKTGHMMVYAVWAARRDFALADPEGLIALSGMLSDSMRYSSEHIDEVAKYAAKYEDFSEDFLSDYFKSLRYDFSDEAKAGLEYFLKEAFRLRLIHKDAPLVFIKDVICTQ